MSDNREFSNRTRVVRMDVPIVLTSKVLRELPTMYRILRCETIKDMAGDEREAILVMWRADASVGGGIRQAHFCTKTGEYLGEY